MDTTTTTLPTELRNALTEAGLTTKTAAYIADLLPPAGQHALLTDLQSNPAALRELVTAWEGDTAERLRISFADARVLRGHARLAVTR